MITKIKNISLFGLIMLIAGAIDSIRNMPAAALFGNELIFFFVFAAIVFLIPTALVSAELSACWTERGGIYYWSELAFGSKVGFLAIWLQWINTIIWYPTILSFIAGTAAYLINPSLASNKAYLVSIILIVFWLMTLVNLRGLKTSTRFASFCTISGLIIPVTAILSLTVIWIITGKPIQLHLTPKTMLPQLNDINSWISLTAIITSFLGMELATVHVNRTKNPQRTFPRAMLFSVIIILFTMTAGSLAIALILPRGNIKLVDGVMEAFNNFFHIYHLTWAVPIITILILIGSIGSMINWIISPAKGLQQAARENFLPKWLGRNNSHGVAANILIVQAILVSFVCLAFLLMPSVNGSYWLLTDLSTELYLLMYLFMFLSVLILRYKFPNRERPFQIPGGKFGVWLATLLGITGCCLTLIIGFFPPKSINVGGTVHYEILFASGILLLVLPALVIVVLKDQK